MGICNVHFLLPSLWLFFTVIASSYAENAPTPFSSSSLLPAPPPPPPPAPPPYRSRDSPFRPSIAIVVAILTTIFSITFLLLLYAKHCKRESATAIGSGGGWTNASFRKNSGIDRTVIESLPVFRFGSLRGQRAEGLECAVCLNKFESSEILRLLPKCKHAFHVECVDTWLDAHSTCPLCRYQVDPEDILLISHETKSVSSVTSSPVKEKQKIHSSSAAASASASSSIRHSSAGERCTSSSSSLQIIVETPKEEKSWSLNKRMSLDSWNLYRKKCKSTNNSAALLTRKDGMLLNSNNKKDAVQGTEDRRLEHRIIISGDRDLPETSVCRAQYQRWSDVEACDMLYLRSGMILSESRRYSGSRKRTVEIEGRSGGSGRGVINERSVSEMTGMSRFMSNEDERERERQRKGAVQRWLDWISLSQNKSVPDNNVSVSGGVAASSSFSSAT